MVDINENSVSGVLLNDGWHQPIAGTFKIGNIRIHADAAAGTDFGKSSATWDENSASFIRCHGNRQRAAHVDSRDSAKKIILGDGHFVPLAAVRTWDGSRRCCETAKRSARAIDIAGVIMRFPRESLLFAPRLRSMPFFRGNGRGRSGSQN